MRRRSLSEKASLLMFGHGLRLVSDLLIAMVLVRVVSQAEYGTYRQAALLFGTVSLLGALGVPASLAYFLPRLGAAGQGPLIRRLLLLLLAAGTAGVVPIVLFARSIETALGSPELAYLLVVGALWPAGQILSQMLPYYFVAVGRHRAAALVNGAIAILQPLLILTPVLMGGGMRGAFLGTVLSWIVAGGMAVAILLRAAPGGAEAPAIRMGEVLNYSIPLSMGSVLGGINQRIDRYIVSLFHPPAVFAVFATGAVEFPLVFVLTTSVGVMLIPEFATLDREGRRDAILPIWQRGIRKLSLIMFPSFAFLFLFAPDLVRILYTESYLAAADVFRIYLLLLPFRVAGYGSIIQAVGKSREILVASILGLSVNLLGGLILVQTWGWTGPAWASVLGQLTMNTFLVWRIAHHLGVSPGGVFPLRTWAAAWLPALIAALVAFPATFLSGPPLLRLIAGGVLFAVAYLVGVIVTGSLEAGDRRLLFDWLTLRVLRRAEKH